MAIKFASSKSRLLHFLDYKGITKADFYKQTGLKRGLLDADKLDSALSDVVIAIIIASYSDLSMNWLVLGRGHMLRSVEEKELLKANDQSNSRIEKPVIISLSNFKELLASDGDRDGLIEAYSNALQEISDLKTELIELLKQL